MGAYEGDDEEDDEQIQRDQLNQALREFLEQSPLYAPFRFKTPTRLSAVYNGQVWPLVDTWPDAVTLRCVRCALDTTWQLVEKQKNTDDVPFEFYEGNYLLRYTCVRCARTSSAFWVSAESDADRTSHVIRKQGQSPAWSIEPAASIAKALPVQAIEFYRKGLICTSHNFGLGAVGYFRRVVEQVTGHLLDLVEANAKEHGDQATVDAIAKARAEFPATERLKHAASLLPPALRPGGKNPLASLYDSYSEGVHSLSDEECMEVARDVRAGLDYLLPALHEQLAAARAYQASMTKAKRRKPSQG